MNGGKNSKHERVSWSIQPRIAKTQQNLYVYTVHSQCRNNQQRNAWPMFRIMHVVFYRRTCVHCSLFIAVAFRLFSLQNSRNVNNTISDITIDPDIIQIEPKAKCCGFAWLEYDTITLYILNYFKFHSMPGLFNSYPQWHIPNSHLHYWCELLFF